MVFPSTRIPAKHTIQSRLSCCSSHTPSLLCSEQSVYPPSSPLMCRVPLLVLPRRITWWFQWFFFLIIPGPLINLVLPLTLTHASIRSVPLVVAARNNSRLRVLDTDRGHPFTSYRMAKMILSAARLATALSMGIGGWVYGARQELLAWISWWC